MSEESDSLASFGPGFQQAIVGYCLVNLSFLTSCRALVQPEWFNNLAYVDITRIIFQLYDFKKLKTNADRMPTELEVRTALLGMYPKPSDYNPRIEALILCQAAANAKNIDLQWMQERMTGWIRMVKLKNLIEAAKQKFSRKEFSDCVEWVDKRIAEVKQSSFMDDERESFANLVGFIQDFNLEQDTQCCTFGNVDIDNVLRPGSKLDFPSEVAAREDVVKMTKGSLRPGDLTVLIGATNTGKTTTIITIAVKNILMGKYVFLMSHEQDAKQLKMRLLTCMMKVTSQELSTRGPTDEAYKTKLKELEGVLEKYLHYRHYAHAGGMYVEDVVGIIEQAQDSLRARRLITENVAKGFDLVINDYPAKLKSRLMIKSQGWEEKTYVYNEFLNLAQSHQFHCIAPAQTGRAGVRISRGETNDGRMLEVDDIAESFGITTIAANVITVNRSAIDQNRGLLRFYVSKCRSPGKGTTIIVPSEFDRASTFATNGLVKILPSGKTMSEPEIMSYFGVPGVSDITTETPRQTPADIEPLSMGTSNYDHETGEIFDEPMDPVVS
jgi:KaiC/GvpD/RAD55 family RecA-like ATPase